MLKLASPGTYCSVPAVVALDPGRPFSALSTDFVLAHRLPCRVDVSGDVAERTASGPFTVPTATGRFVCTYKLFLTCIVGADIVLGRDWLACTASPSHTAYLPDPVAFPGQCGVLWEPLPSGEVSLPVVCRTAAVGSPPGAVLDPLPARLAVGVVNIQDDAHICETRTGCSNERGHLRMESGQRADAQSSLVIGPTYHVDKPVTFCAWQQCIKSNSGTWLRSNLSYDTMVYLSILILHPGRCLHLSIMSPVQTVSPPMLVVTPEKRVTIQVFDGLTRTLCVGIS
ncbi:hypothetical protein PsYK624_133150 [Phanerochaete sordida]|uniref:Uncharacterized protein n=1 Tax=Phanerochaete sordida TaxID=48140 RepID=A0A9P3LJW8_9APHY|nr:hypothetical protein PsYK624_133150 [Phanerochaete sordida]